MPANSITLIPPPNIKAAYDEAKNRAAKGREVLDAFSQGIAIDPAQVDELTAALRAGNARFREEWAALRTELPDGRMIFTPDFLAVQILLAGVNPDRRLAQNFPDAHSCIFGINNRGRVLALNLSDLDIPDIAPLSGLTALETLHLTRNRICDLNPLSGLKALQELDLANNQVRDLGALSGLWDLKRLDLDENGIEDLRPLSGLAALERLFLRGNPIQDLSPICSLPALQTIGLTISMSNPALLKDVQALQARKVHVSNFDPHHAR
jgi:hypothetical protein